MDFEVFFEEVFGESGFGGKFGTEIEVVLAGGGFGGEVGLGGDIEEFEVVVDVDLVGFDLVVDVGELEFLLIGEMDGRVVVVLVDFVEAIPSEPGGDKGFGLNEEVVVEG